MAAAYAVKRYSKQAQDEISFEVSQMRFLTGDIAHARDCSVLLSDPFEMIKPIQIYLLRKIPTCKKLV